MNKLKLYSNDTTISSKLKELENNKKQYSRLLEGLVLLGKFESKAEVELYENIKNDVEEKTIVYCTDVNSDLLMFYIDSTDKKDYLKLTKVTYSGDRKYDLALAKKFELTKENIELTRTDKVYNFKFGRLITDEKTFYTIFLSEDNVYKIEIEEPNNIPNISNIINSLNSLEQMPSLMNYIDIFSKQNISFKSAKTEVYKDFVNIGTYVINNNEDDKNKNKLI